MELHKWKLFKPIRSVLMQFVKYCVTVFEIARPEMQIQGCGLRPVINLRASFYNPSSNFRLPLETLLSGIYCATMIARTNFQLSGIARQ
jgi:hypothetical protein